MSAPRSLDKIIETKSMNGTQILRAAHAVNGEYGDDAVIHAARSADK